MRPLREALATFGNWTIEIVKRTADAAGFQLLPRGDGSSNELSPGSIETAASPKISRLRSPAPKPGSTSPPCRCSLGDWPDNNTIYTIKIRTLRNGNGTVLSQAVLNPYAYGQFLIDDNANGSSLVFTCENATLTSTNFRNDPSINFFIIRGTAQPQVKSMSATLNGTDIGIFPVPPVVPLGILPSDYLTGREGDNLIGPPSRFLAFKGLDTRAGACQYYQSVGAVAGCDPAGNYQGATLTFNRWRNPLI